MKCASALSTHPLPAQAVGDLIADVLEQQTVPADLAIVFTTTEFAGASEDIVAAVDSILSPHEILFVVSAGVIGAGTEVLRGSAISLWLYWSDGSVPTRDVELFDLTEGVEALSDRNRSDLQTSGALVLIGNPSAESILEIVEDVCHLLPKTPISGALLSAANGPVFILDRMGTDYGCIGVRFSRPLIEVVIAHGSVPLGPPMTVTHSVGNMLCAVDGATALGVAQHLIRRVESPRQSQTARDLAIAVLHPLTGTVVDVYRVLGADRTSESLAIARPVPEQSLISFHRQDRDGATAGLVEALGGGRSGGGLVFASSSVDPASESEGVGDLGILSEAIGSPSFAGAHVSAVIGHGFDQCGLLASPLSAAIFGRVHH